MSDRVRSLIVAFLTLTAVLVFLPTVVQAGVPNCVGTDACSFNTGDIGEGACMGTVSCFANSGDIAKNGCHDRNVCEGNSGAVGEGACHGEIACAQNDGDVRKASCIEFSACFQNSGSVGEASCIGVNACHRNSGAIGKLSCHGEGACFRSGPGAIGKNACRGFRACYATLADRGGHLQRPAGRDGQGGLRVRLPPVSPTALRADRRGGCAARPGRTTGGTAPTLGDPTRGHRRGMEASACGGFSFKLPPPSSALRGRCA